MAERNSVACRECSAGWWGTADERCPTCRKPVVVTGRIYVRELRREAG